MEDMDDNNDGKISLSEYVGDLEEDEDEDEEDKGSQHFDIFCIF